MTDERYPVRFHVDYPDQLDRISTAFRLIWIIPILVVLAALMATDVRVEAAEGAAGGAGGSVGFLVLAPLLLILFRQKYPRWWFDWNLELSRFVARIGAYLLLLTDRYPSTDEQQAVHLEMDYPEVKTDLNRWLPLVKWLLAIPHVFVLFFLWVATIVVAVIAWIAILATGRYPKDLFDFVVGLLRWSYRVLAYAILLVTDRYPPFSLAE